MFDNQITVLKFLQGYGDRLVADVPSEDFCSQPAAGMNHPAWVIGHLAFAVDRHATFLGAEQTLGDWKEKFGFGSTPTTDPADYPAKDELIAAWHGSNDRLIAILESASPEQLAAANEHVRPESLPTLGDFFTFSMAGHTAIHLGQLSAWRRAGGRPPA